MVDRILEPGCSSSLFEMETVSRSESQPEIKDHVTVERIQEENLVISITEKMEKISISYCISRVSKETLQGNEKNYYFPTLLSIGPFHHGKKELQVMEDQKWCYLNTLFSRNPNSNVEQSLDKCLHKLRQFEGKARKYYAEEESVVSVNSNKFMEMMLLDGCFIIELFIKFAIKGLRRRDDPLFNSNDRLLGLTFDMMLLENQIPFFILEQLFNLVPIPKQCTQSLTQLALRFFRRLIPGAEVHQERVFPNILHFLDLIRHCYLPTYPESPPKEPRKHLKSAKSLQVAGIKFRNIVAESLLNIEFNNGVIKIPPLKIYAYTETLLRNLIELEHCCSHQYTKHITSYVYFFKCLLQSKYDAKFLRHRGVLTFVSSDKQKTKVLDATILHLFKNLNVDLKVKEFYLATICEKIHTHEKENDQLSFFWCK